MGCINNQILKKGEVLDHQFWNDHPGLIFLRDASHLVLGRFQGGGFFVEPQVKGVVGFGEHPDFPVPNAHARYLFANLSVSNVFPVKVVKISGNLHPAIPTVPGPKETLLVAVWHVIDPGVFSDFKGNRLDKTQRRKVKVRGQFLELTPSEFDLLAALMSAPGRVFSRLDLLDIIQGVRYEGYERTIDTHIKNLLAKIETDPRQPRYIETVYGVGYRFARE